MAAPRKFYGDPVGEAMGMVHRGQRLRVVAAVACVAVVAAVFLGPRLIPLRAVEAVIARRVSAATGVRVEVRGPARITLVPHLGVRLQDVRLGTTTAASPAELAHIPRMDLHLAVAPLLHGRLVVKRLELARPAVAFHVAPDGTPNWTFVGGDASAPSAPPQADDPSRPHTGTGIAFHVETVHIVNGDVTYTDEAHDTRFHLGQMRGTILAPSPTGPFQAEGRFDWNGRRVATHLQAEHLARFLRGDRTTVGLAFDTPGVRLSYRGDLQTREALHAVGVVEMNVPALLHLLTGERDDTAPPAPVRATADLTIAGGRAGFVLRHMTIGETQVAGNARLDWQARPRVFDAAMRVPTLDVASLTSPASAGDGALPDLSAALADARLWQWLRAADGEVTIAIDRVRLGDLIAGRGDIAIGAHGGRLTATFGQAAVADGVLQGRLRLAPDAAGIAYEGMIAANEMNVTDLLHAFTPHPRLAGSGSATLHVRGTGRHAAELVACMQGYGTVTVRQGTLRGVDLAAITGNFPRLVIGGFGMTEAETPFTDLTGTFVLHDGIIHTEDLALHARRLSLTATGQTRLADRTVQYHAILRRPWVRIPMAMTGPWDAMQVRPFGTAEVDGIPSPSP